MRYKKWCCDNGEPEEYNRDTFDNFWTDVVDDYNGKLLPKDETIFWASWISGNTSFYGGYPFDYGLTFTDNGKKYEIFFVGWTGDIESDSKNYAPHRFVCADNEKDQ
jgi:hypothetical protein